MDLEFSDEEAALRANVRMVLDRACTSAMVRDVFEDKGVDPKLWATLTDLYWPALTIAEEHGGLGMSVVDAVIVSEELGRVVAPVPFLSTATQFVPALQHLGGPEIQAAFLPSVADGSLTGTLAVAEHGRWTVDAIETTAVPDGSAWRLDGRKCAVLDASTAAEVVVVARSPGSVGGEGLGAFVVPGSAFEVLDRSVIDPTMPIADLVLEDVVVGAERVLAPCGAPDVGEEVEETIAVSAIALAAATVGTCRALFERTVEYAKVRQQYDRPIGSFQALKHRLADAYLSVERATSLSYYAALTVKERAEDRLEAASLAKAAAGECQRLLAREGLQLHGGIGFTWENDLHFFLKRAKAGDALFGSAVDHRAMLARRLGLVPESITGDRGVDA